MAEPIICHVCGESNPPDMEFCRNCQSRLRPLTGPLKGENAPIQPGAIPTKKVTSELEPLLPQWLREARQQARDTAAEDASNAPPEQESSGASNGDLLAGLASQGSEEDEDVPEWLTQLTGAQAKKKKPVPEDSQVKWVELGHPDEPQQQDAEQDQKEQPAKNEGPGKDELTDWFNQAAASSESADFRLPPAPNPDQNQLDATQPSKAEDIGWLRNLDAAASMQPEQPAGESAPPPREEAPEWLKKLQADQTPPEAPKPAAPVPSRPQADVPDWLKSFAQETPATPAPEPVAPAEPLASEQPLPDWLHASESLAAEPVQPEVGSDATAAAADLPDWVTALSKAQQPVQEETRPGVPVFEAKQPTTPTPAASTAEPDWMSSLREQAETPVTETQPVVPADEPEKSAAQAFSDESLSSHDVDAIFASMQTPDWLSSVLPSVPAEEENIPPAAQQEQPIAAADLPSWVQAMRPVESAMGATPGRQDDAEKSEGRGPLAGLNGVLPAIPDAVIPSSKPKAQSLKLDASEQQQAHAVLLEQIVAAETSPIPMKSAGALLRSQRTLRWALSVLLIVLLGGAIFTRTQIFQLPAGVPNETIGAIDAVEAVPADAPVLVVFDYQPSTIGEMEASAAPLLDHLLLLKHPRLVLLSTSPTGPALAERFMSTTLAARAYARNLQYIDLGYLPGGLAGVYNFAQNPRTAVPLDIDSRPVWQSAILGPIQNFSDFAAIIVLTDTAESGRTWVEQTQASRGKSMMVFVASAQAGPMLLPYVDSGQVNGMVSGLYGAVGAEQRNAGSPGYIRNYWDAYSIGLYLAVMLIVLGGLWNLWRGIQDRRSGVTA